MAARAIVVAQPLPFHYIEIAVALFKHAGDAFGDRRQRVYDLVENIRRRVGRCARAAPPLARTGGLTRRAARHSVRFNKIERGLRRLDGARAAYIRLNNVSAMEARSSACVVLPPHATLRRPALHACSSLRITHY